jgi:beta-glucosidase
MLSNSIIAVGALLTGVASGQATSPPKYPSPWINADFNWEDPSPVPTNGRTWAEAYDKAVQFVGELTLLEKVNLTTGVGWEGGSCVGNTGSIPRLGFPGLCNQDSPLGVRDSKSSLHPIGLHENNFKMTLFSGRKLCLPSRSQCGVNLEPEPDVRTGCGHGS